MAKQANSFREVQAEAARYNEEQNQTILILKGGTLMLLEAELIVKRAALRWLTERHPSWTRA